MLKGGSDLIENYIRDIAKNPDSSVSDEEAGTYIHIFIYLYTNILLWIILLIIRLVYHRYCFINLQRSTLLL